MVPKGPYGRSVGLRHAPCDTPRVGDRRGFSMGMEVAGPVLFTKYVKDCVAPPYFDPSLNVHHAEASAAWANDKSYFSWTLERMKQAGWSTMYEH